MRLYQSATSPFARKVMVVIHETGLQGIELAPVAGTPVAPGSMPVDRNPLGKIPALVLDDGRTIFDSRVICRYLDDCASAGLYPPGDRLWDTLTLESLADGILDAAVLMVYESRLRPEDGRFAPWVEGQWAKIDRSLQAVEDRWRRIWPPRWIWARSRLARPWAIWISALARGTGRRTAPHWPPGGVTFRPARQWPQPCRWAEPAPLLPQASENRDRRTNK